LGHYRTHQTGGNYPGNNVRTSFTYYNPAQGTYGQSNFSMLPASSPWVLGTYAFDWDAEGSSTQFRSYCWDANGQMLRKRVHAANGSAQGTSDVIQVNAFAAGNVTSESWYGGDTQPFNLSGSDFCATTLPASPAYQINHAFGRPGTIRPADGAAHDVTISYAGVRQVSRTAKVATSSTAETSQTTTEVYDRHGRLYEVTEPNNVKTRYDYDVGNRLAKVCQGVTGTACGQTRLFTYDNRGFLTSETHPEKAGGVAYSYDALGHAARKVDGPNDLTYVYDKAERLALVREFGAGFTDCASNAGHRCLKARA
jgi:YD repeat-containing protein